ncbi:MAG: fibronectin type III domain-containing protein [Bacteroidetes bacterium]|nr:fibronectin type III domain-containing protein [Bacteroidota bacterium]
MKKLLLLISLLGVVGLTNAQTDPMEFATGTLSATQQLQSYPLPRLKPGHTLNRNFIWFDIEYFSGWQQPGVSRTQMVATAKVNNEEFYKNWNYYYMINGKIDSYGTASSYADTVTSTPGVFAAIAKRNPSYKTSAICLMNQTPLITSQNLTPDNYVRNSSGQYLDMGGNVVSGVKYFSPTAPNSTLISDGSYLKPYFQTLLNALGRPLDIMNDNGEAMYLMSLNGKVIDNDPVVKADYLNLGYPASKTTESINDYRGRKYAQQVSLYRDQFMSISPSTAYTFYGLDGQSDYRPVWPRGKAIQSKINGHHYSTGDFYLRWPDNWKAWAGAWHGLGWFADCKYFEEKAGDSLMSPFVCAGWNADETQNPRPAQYLACLKVLAAWGSEFFYTGFFNLSTPFPDAKNWGWQTVMPVYTQGIVSRYEEFLRNGTLLEGDVPRYFLTTTTLQPNNPKYLFYTGDARKLVAVRKLNGANKYVITAAQMVDANTIGNAPNSSFAKFKLGNDSIKIEFRRQGSVYIYDATNPSAKVFYQLDKWHQYEHPERWSKDFELEAELADNSSSSAKIATEVPAGTPANDYTNYTSYITFTSATPTVLQYSFNPRNQPTYYFWVRARSKNSTGGGISVGVNGQASKSIGCITDTQWKWYSVDACSGQNIKFTSLASQQYLLSLTASSSNIEIDKVLLTTNASTNLNPNQPACGTVVATVNTSGPTTFCQGGSVTLTASAGNSYTWSNGQTTQAITVSQSGSYSVSVNTGTGCAAVSAPVAVTVNASTPATISNSGPTNFCQGGNVTLTASSGNAYNWSNGQTTQSITVSQSGSYSVSVNTGNGCTAVSAPVNVSVTSAIPATVTSSGPLTFCQGGNVTLTASTGASFTWSNGLTSPSITVSSSGTYSVVVANSNGCTSASNPVNVSVAALPTPAITVNGPTTLNIGQSTILTASNASSYLWQPGGQTTASITVSTPGNYSVRVTNAAGCTATSSAVTISQVNTPSPVLIQVIGSTSFCVGGAVGLTANGGTNYLWAPGGQTTATISANQAGTYYVYSRDNNGNVLTTDSVTLRVHPKPMDPSISITYIPNTAFQLNAYEPSAVSYRWSSGANAATINVIQPKLMSVTATNAFGCTSGATSILTGSVTPRTCITPNMLTSYNISDTTAMLGWNPAITGERFIIRYWIPGTSNIMVKEVGGSISSWRINNLIPGTTYNWTLENLCISGSYMSTTSSFKTLGTPLFCGSTPQHLRSESITTQRATVRWYTTTADSFMVRYRPVGTSTYFFRNIQGSMNSTGIQLINLLTNTNYEWQVNSTCSGFTSPYSQTQFFKTLDTCGFMGNVSATNITASTARIVWSNINSMDTIRIRYTRINTGVEHNTYFNATGQSGSYELRGLKPGSTYSVEVRGRCGGTAGAWTSPVLFNTTNITTREDASNPFFLNGYPNPVNDILFYSFITDKNEDYTVKVCDMAGRELIQEVRNSFTGENVEEIPVQGFAKGAYLLILQQGTQRSNFRFSVQ